jgi:hypothetical protein
MNLMKRSYEKIQTDHRDFEDCLAELRAHRAWEKVPLDSPYGSEEEMLAAELGKRAAEIAAQLAQIKQTASDRAKTAAIATTGEVKREGRPNRETAQFAQFNQEERAEQIGVRRRTQQKLDALARRRPDLLDEVRSGRKTAHRAAVEAGIMKEPSPFEQIERLIAKHLETLTPEEKQALKEMLND